MYALRKWSVRHARLMESVYSRVERTLLALAPQLERIGHERLERPVAAVERVVKGALFDCRMCGQCALSSAGMSCPMNCPKNIRNGPCGGVRPDGYCEVKPDMRCVWVEGWEGAKRMRDGRAIHTVQFAVDHRLQGSSSWLRVVREKTATELSEKALGNVEPVRPVNAAPTGTMRGASAPAASPDAPSARPDALTTSPDASSARLDASHSGVDDSPLRANDPTLTADRSAPAGTDGRRSGAPTADTSSPAESAPGRAAR